MLMVVLLLGFLCIQPLYFSAPSDCTFNIFILFTSQKKRILAALIFL